jgi:hypothetical protein
VSDDTGAGRGVGASTPLLREKAVKKTVLENKTEKGQATMEFVAVLPVLIGVFFLALAMAVFMYAHALGSHLALEGGARESAAPGSGTGFANGAVGRAAPSFALGAGSSPLSTGVGEGYLFRLSGWIEIPWAPFGIEMRAPVSSAVAVPQWEFKP